MAIRGLLIEGAGTNLFKNSTLVSPLTNWSALVSGTRPLIASLLGSADGASAIRMSANAQQPYLESGPLALADNTNYCVSFWVEEYSLTGGNPTIGLLVNGGTGAFNFDFNETGTGMPGGTLPKLATWKFRTGVGAGAASIRLGLGVANVATGFLQLSRPQLEAGETPTSFMPGGVGVNGSRSADQVTKLLNSFNYNTAEGTWESEFYTPRYFGADAVVHQQDNGTENYRIRLVIDTTGHLRLIVTSNNVEVVNLDGGLLIVDSLNGAAYRYGGNDWALSVNGGAAVKSTSGAVPAGLTTLRRGHGVSGSPLNAELAKLACYRSKKDDATLATVSAIGGVAPPPPPPSGDFPQKWYGYPFGGPITSLGNDNISGSNMYAHMFVANYTGTITKLSWYQANRDTAGDYSAGTGGKIRARICKLRADGFPDLTQIIGVAAIAGAYSQGWNVTPTMTTPAPVVAGGHYAIVWDNIDANPSANFNQVDEMNTEWCGHDSPHPYAPTPMSPFLEDKLYGRAYRSTNNGSTWSPRTNRVPNSTIWYADGHSQGNGTEHAYGTAPAKGHSITNTAWVRQVFVPHRSFTATKFGACVGIEPGSGTDPLTVRIYQGTTLIQQLQSITAAMCRNPALWPHSNLGTVNTGSNADRRWQVVNLSPILDFTNGTQYIVELRATAATPYYMGAVRRGPSTWAPATSDGTMDGPAQYSSNSGGSWSDWDANRNTIAICFETT